MSQEELAKIIRQTAEMTAHQTVVNLLKKGMLKTDALLTMQQVKERYQISSTTVRRWVSDGVIKIVQKGNKKFYKIQEDANV
jgi:DNA-binding GntR family transcriptional regulator